MTNGTGQNSISLALANSLASCFGETITVGEIVVRRTRPGPVAEEAVVPMSYREMSAKAHILFFDGEQSPPTVELYQGSFSAPDCRNYLYPQVGFEFLVYLEAVAMCWKHRNFGTTDGVYVLPKGIIENLWERTSDFNHTGVKSRKVADLAQVTAMGIHNSFLTKKSIWWEFLGDGDLSTRYIVKTSGGGQLVANMRLSDKEMSEWICDLRAIQLKSLLSG